MIKIDWVEIPKGDFIAGLSVTRAKSFLEKLDYEIHWKDILSLETPEIKVSLETFYISRYPITNKQYFEFAESEHRYSHKNVFKGKDRRIVLSDLEEKAENFGDHPAVTVWHSAMAFCEWIGARLPTSIEWEKAARGVDGRLYPWGNEWDPSCGSFTLNYERWQAKTSPVSAYDNGRSPYGVVDMIGNVCEYTLSTTIKNSGGRNCEFVICRGSHCDYNATKDKYSPAWFRNRVTNRYTDVMNFGGGPLLVGFRPVLDKWQSKVTDIHGIK